MKKLTTTEENYLKAIYALSEQETEVRGEVYINTNAIAERLEVRAASVTDMLQRLEKKQIVKYAKRKGVLLTKEGDLLAKDLIRKHRLWEVFLLEKLNFKWDEVHDLAEQLEHIQSIELTNRLEAFLGFPKFDPHGDPIPDRHGNVPTQNAVLLAKIKVGTEGILTAVDEHEPDLLQHLEEQQLFLNTSVKLLKRYAFDNSLEILLNNERTITVSEQVSKHIYIQQ